jgi:hypothetical protein
MDEMNENLKQVLDQASTIRYSGMGDTVTIDYEKFTQLLIEKCAEVVADLDGGENMFSRGIREYFGEK